MLNTLPLPVILTCSGCVLAFVLGTAFRVTNSLGGTARLGFLPKRLTRWLNGINQSSKPR
jgi:hypothetical protein